MAVGGTVLDQCVLWAAISTGIFFFLSPVQTVQTVHKRPNTVHNVNPVNLLSIYANCSLWVVYGYFLPLYAVIPGNSVGLVSSLYCIVSCWWHAIKTTEPPSDGMWNRRTAAYTVGCALSSLLALMYVGLRLHERAAEHAGNLAMLLLILMYGAPLSALNRVLQSRSSASLPFSQCFLGWLSGCCWVIVGIRQESPPILVPNALGVVLYLVQLGFILYFPSTGYETLDADVEAVELAQTYGVGDASEKEPGDNLDKNEAMEDVASDEMMVMPQTYGVCDASEKEPLDSIDGNLS